jgi:hypothetical protein
MSFTEISFVARSPGNMRALPRQAMFGRVRLIRNLRPVRDEAPAPALCSR